MNWVRMSRFCAPMALRMPISRVRSVTETSMMFMIPTPAASSAMELTSSTPEPEIQREIVELLDERIVGEVGEVVFCAGRDIARRAQDRHAPVRLRRPALPGSLPSP